MDFALLNIPPQLSRPNVELDFKYINTNVDHWKRDEWLDEVSRILDEMDFDYDYSDTHLSFEKMRNYEVIFASTYDFMDKDEQEKLIQYAGSGGKLIIGPGVPYIDTNMNSCTSLLNCLNLNNKGMKGSISLIECAADAKRCLSETELSKEFSVSQEDIELLVYQGNERKLLFMANPTKNAYDVTLSFAGQKHLKAALNAYDVFGMDDASISIDPYKVMVWEVEE